MKPIQICTHLGKDTIDAFFDELSAREIRSVFRASGVRTNVGSAAYSRTGRLAVWRKRLHGELDKGNEKVALAFLLEWLVGHHNEMLVDYLDHLEVPHRNGQTDEDFCETRTPDQLREAAEVLLAKYPAQHVAVYLLLVGHLQECDVFDGMEALTSALSTGGGGAEAAS
ncbi:MAG: hypothetical protein D6705_16780 [Deltaproteobacteria bacterium]|nr:MAG: hypothetical protein D6705_16780 [Deltaproteobacteria bacterium]